jgi:hypothetical protein
MSGPNCAFRSATMDKELARAPLLRDTLAILASWGFAKGSNELTEGFSIKSTVGGSMSIRISVPKRIAYQRISGWRDR